MGDTSFNSICRSMVSCHFWCNTGEYYDPLGGGGQSNPIPINVSGVQYNTSGIEYALDMGGNSLGGGCTLDEVNLPIITVEGSNCISTAKLINPTNSSPFIFLRPMFGLDDGDVISALKGLPEGTYSASVPIIIRYYYENNSITTFRNINEVIIFSFRYSPVQLDSIDVIGDGVMIPLYDTTNRRVTSNTSFDINAFGYFDDGIILTLPNQEYELVNSSEPSVTIPYSINCVQCSSMNLVRDGILFNNDVSIGEGSGAQTNIGFSLEFDYDVNGENILSGEYFDEVTIILEPSI